MSGVAFPDTAIAVRPDPTLLNRAYFSALWGTAFIRQQIDSIAKTTNGTFKINQTGLAGVRVPLPAPERQRQFARLADKLQSIQSQQAIALEKAVATFDALLARAFSAQGAADAMGAFA
jgi:type I restriction enzyme S subunit